MKKLYFLPMILVLCASAFPLATHPHEITGEVTPLMRRMELILQLIEAKQDEKAFEETQRITEDFSDEGQTETQQGLKNTIARVDRKFGTDIKRFLDEAFKKKDPVVLKKALQSLALLLMLEKFDVLEETFGKNNVNLDTQRTIFWLGRNYFSFLLEPTLAKYDPAEELWLDRLLDRMLYRLEDGKWQEFISIRKELVNRITNYFKLPSSVLNATAYDGRPMAK